MSGRVIVAGGGAAGFFGAIACAEANPSLDVLLLEKSPELLAKVTISGGGRCNVTHHCFDVDRLVRHYPRGSRELIGPFHRFQPRDTVAWFESRGVALKVEADGRMFPTTDSSSTIVKCLLSAARSAGVTIRTGCGLRGIAPREGGGIDVALTTGETVSCDRVLLATGGNKNTAGYRLASSVGHTIEPPVPSLFTFNIDDSALHALAGISMPAATVRAPEQELEQSGPLLITHWGVSGPAALKLSAWGARAFAGAQYEFPLEVAWQPGAAEAWVEVMMALRTTHPTRAIVAGGVIDAPSRLWEWMCRRADVPLSQRWGQVSRERAARLAGEIARGRFEVRGKSMFKEEFVTCGGVRLSEVNFKTMESKCCPGLHLAGEVLDIDAVTGGFNFQAAWTTGWIAGQAMASGLPSR